MNRSEAVIKSYEMTRCVVLALHVVETSPTVDAARMASIDQNERYDVATVR